MNTKTAILIFANSAKKDAERKPFLSTEVFSELNKQTLKTVIKSKIDYFFISEKQQVGNSFAERFNNAIQFVFNKAYQNVIAIGNDTPHLKTKHLLKTLCQLSKKQLIIGPSKDGGVYLLGIQKEYFNTQSFCNLPWQTCKLTAAISKKAALEGTKITKLELLADIDSKTDLFTVLSSFTILSKKIRQLLNSFILIKKVTTDKVALFIQLQYTSLFFNKGSPLFISK